jgi:hypothetical protein
MTYKVCSVRMKSWGPFPQPPIPNSHACRFWGIKTRTTLTFRASISCPGDFLTYKAPDPALSCLLCQHLCLRPQHGPGELAGGSFCVELCPGHPPYLLSCVQRALILHRLIPVHHRMKSKVKAQLPCCAYFVWNSVRYPAVQANPQCLGTFCRFRTFLASAPTPGPLVRSLSPITCDTRWICTAHPLGYLKMVDRATCPA